MANGAESEQPTNRSIKIADLVQAEEQGLDLNRLLFVKHLVLTKRLTEFPEESEQAEPDSIEDSTSSIAPAGVVFDGRLTEILKPAILEPEDNSIIPEGFDEQERKRLLFWRNRVAHDRTLDPNHPEQVYHEPNRISRSGQD